MKPHPSWKRRTGNFREASSTGATNRSVSRTGRCLSFILLSVLLASGCAAVKKRNPLQEELSHHAQVEGIPHARYWGDEPPAYVYSWLSASPADLEREHPGILGREHNYLVLSGGGANGAFGAGLLMGWSDAGTRPEFTIVTGISTGALIAPFAFLGSDYDARLKEVYTTYSTKDLLKKRRLLRILGGDAAADTAPLRAMIARYIDEETMQAMAAEYRRGRRLLIGTTNLDAARPVIWDVSRIAASGAPGALDLIRDVMLASASIPVAFPPVLFPVTTQEGRFDEMHVDGGVTTQVFLFPVGLDWKQVTEKLDVKGTPNLYVIRNARLKPKWKAVEPKIPSITGRSISSLIRTQGIGDMYRMYLRAQEDGMNYYLACIPDEFDEESKEPFDKEYMGKLFQRGYRLARDGYPWSRFPPGYSPRTE